MSMFMILKIRNNGLNHLKSNLFLNEILFYATIHISVPFNHIHKTQTKMFFLTKKSLAANILLITFFLIKKNPAANVFV